MATHVDNILTSAPVHIRKATEQALSGVFPIDSWEGATEGLEYCGVTVKQEGDKATLSQEHYVNSRLETVEIPNTPQVEDFADEVKMDNQSIGALSWLASQTRPDLQAGVSMAQRKQKNPTYGDIKETNQVVRMAQQAKGEKVTYQNMGNMEDLLIMVYHTVQGGPGVYGGQGGWDLLAAGLCPAHHPHGCSGSGIPGHPHGMFQEGQQEEVAHRVGHRL